MKAILLTIGLVLGMFFSMNAHALNESVDPKPGYNTPETEYGAQIGLSTSSKVGFHAAVPSVQRASVSQTSVVTTAATSSSPYGYATQEQADALVTLVNELRAAMVEKGLIKGSQ